MLANSSREFSPAEHNAAILPFNGGRNKNEKAAATVFSFCVVGLSTDSTFSIFSTLPYRNVSGLFLPS